MGGDGWRAEQVKQVRSCCWQGVHDMRAMFKPFPHSPTLELKQ